MFIVGGTFNKDGGKPSYIISQLMKFLNADGVNGGYLTDLELDFASMSTLIWMPNIDNGEDKILPSIKKVNPHLLLIQSKRVIEKEYTEGDVVGRLLASKSLLGIMISKVDDIYSYRLIDPLGNKHCQTTSLEDLANSINARVSYIKCLTRVGSKSIGSKRDFSIASRFIDIIQRSGTEFTKFVNAVNPNRLLGNASTRCSYGFPASREGDRIFVTRRNVDKQTLSEADFVEVTLSEKTIEFYGEAKPSVDTPIQIMLFNQFPIKYMIHGHVYVADAELTTHKIPCGFIEEYDDIVDHIIDENSKEFAINLRGHGCLIACENLDFFDKIKFVGRPFPEE